MHDFCVQLAKFCVTPSFLVGHCTCHPIWDYGTPNVDQFSCPTNKHPEFVRVIYDPFIMPDAYWTGEQVERSDLHLEFVHLGCTN